MIIKAEQESEQTVKSADYYKHLRKFGAEADAEELNGQQSIDAKKAAKADAEKLQSSIDAKNDFNKKVDEAVNASEESDANDRSAKASADTKALAKSKVDQADQNQDE